MRSFFNKPLFVLFLGLTAYLPLVRGYFIQEEWHVFLNYYLRTKGSYLENVLAFFVPEPGQYIPIGQVVAYTVFTLFGSSYYAFLIAGMMLHVLVGYLMYVWLCEVTKLKTLSLISAFIFVIAPHHFQATSWIVSNLGYSVSSILMILSIIFFWRWLKKDSLKLIVTTSVLILVSLLAKDISMFLLIGLPITAYIFTKKYYVLLKSLLIVFPGMLLEGWHFWYLKNHPLQYLLIGDSPNLISLFTLPLRSIAQSILPQHFIYFLAKVLLFFFPPISLEKLQTTKFNQNVESTGAGLIVLIVVALVIWLGKWIRSKNKDYFIFYLSSVLLTAVSGLPYLFVDTKTFSLLQPRYVYTGLICLGLAFVVLQRAVIKKFGFAAKLSLTLIVLSLFSATFIMSRQQAEIGAERKNLLEFVGNRIPTNAKNIIIYTQSDSSYYGMPDDIKILPFQVNFGKAFGIYRYKHLNLPKEFYPYETLRDLSDQGYWEDENGGFGYFWEYSRLAELLKLGKFSVTDVYAFSYSGKYKQISDQTSQTRQRLEAQLNIN